MYNLKKTAITFFTITALSLLMVLSITIMDKGQGLGDVQFFSTVFAQSDIEFDDCSFCPDADDLKMGEVQCSSGGVLARCIYGGSGCSASAQTPATC